MPDWELEIEKNLLRVDQSTSQTSIEGIFAIGDVCSYPGKLKLILSGFHESALMDQECFKYCFPNKKNVFRYTKKSSCTC